MATLLTAEQLDQGLGAARETEVPAPTAWPFVLAVGFTLDELGTVLKVRDRGGVPCRRVRELAAEKLLAVESRLSELSALRDELRSSLKDWDRRLAQTDPAAPAGLLEALASSRNNHVNRSLRPALSGRNPKRTGVKL